MKLHTLVAPETECALSTATDLHDLHNKPACLPTSDCSQACNATCCVPMGSSDQGRAEHSTVLIRLLSQCCRFANDAKGEALYMMELVLSLEKLNFHKLRLLHDIACKHDDAEMADFIGVPFLQSLLHHSSAVPSSVQPTAPTRTRRAMTADSTSTEQAAVLEPAEGQLLADQSRSVKEVAEYVSQLRRVGQGAPHAVPSSADTVRLPFLKCGSPAQQSVLFHACTGFSCKNLLKTC